MYIYIYTFRMVFYNRTITLNQLLFFFVVK